MFLHSKGILLRRFLPQRNPLLLPVCFHHFRKKARFSSAGEKTKEQDSPKSCSFPFGKMRTYPPRRNFFSQLWEEKFLSLSLFKKYSTA